MPRLLRFAALPALLLCAGCAISTPFEGPGYDPRQGFTADTPDRLVVAVTNGELGDDSALQRRFWDHVGKVEASLAARDGFVGRSKRKELFGNQVWTMSVWADTDSLERFVASEAHQAAMREAYAALETARFARFEIAASDLPVDWDMALARLQAEAKGTD